MNPLIPSMRAGSCYKPKYRYGEKPEGEDAHCIIPGYQTIVVADGVGGNSKRKIDSGDYARQLMANIQKAFASSTNEAVEFDYLKEVLDRGYKCTSVPGSSTVCLVTLSGHDLLCLNVGDSGFRVIREGKTVYSSSPQVHAHDCPFALGGLADEPSCAETSRVRVEIGDVVVLATDGLFDNVFLDDLEGLVNDGKRDSDTPQGLAKRIVEDAHRKSIDQRYRCPFAIEAQKVGRPHLGGKKDDITVVVAYIE